MKSRKSGERRLRGILSEERYIDVAIYHLSAKVIGRKAGRSSVAAAAYRSGDRLRDMRQGIEHDYRRKGGVVHTEIIAPENAPEWMQDRDRLWNAVEAVERRKDAQLAREIEVALPRELDHMAHLDLLREFVGREFVARGMIADLAIHETVARDGQRQPHAHIMLTMRALISDGFGPKNRGWNSSDMLVGWREAWARDANAALELAGSRERVDHRTLEAQREEAERSAEQAHDMGQDELAFGYEKQAVNLSREPEIKLGAAANALEKRGIQSERGDLFRAAQNRNAVRRKLGLEQLELKLLERGRTFIDAGRKRLEGLWERAEIAMTKVRERFAGTDGRKVPSDDLKREKLSIQDQGSDFQQEGSVRDNADKARRDAVLGRSGNLQKASGKDRIQDQDRER